MADRVVDVSVVIQQQREAINFHGFGPASDRPQLRRELRCTASFNAAAQLSQAT